MSEHENSEPGASSLVTELATALVPLFTRLHEALVAAEPMAREIVLGLVHFDTAFRDFSEHAPEVLRRVVAGHGLIVPVTQMSLPDLVAMVKLYDREGEAALVACVRQHYVEIFERDDALARFADVWVRRPLLQPRLSILREALRAHELKMFAVSIPTLVAQFEGIIADVTSHSGKMDGAKLKSHVEKLTQGEPVTGSVLSSFVVETLLSKFEHGLPIPPFSRHAILHGGDVQYATETNSQTVILLVDHVSVLTLPAPLDVPAQ